MPRDLTLQQRGFVKDYLETGNATLAAIRNYNVRNDNSARVIASQNLAKPAIRQTIHEALEVHGLTNDHLAGKIAELVNATKRVTILRNGEIELVKEEVDSYAVKSGLDFVFRIKEAEIIADSDKLPKLVIVDDYNIDEREK